jgi:hypothetical protein
MDAEVVALVKGHQVVQKEVGVVDILLKDV